MKKFLVAIALALVTATLLMLPAVGADNPQLGVDELIKWNVLGDNLHYVGEPTTTPPEQDGNIRKNEYTYSYTYVDPIFPCNGDYNKIAYNPDTDFSSHSMQIFVSYDEDYIYVGIIDDQNKMAGKRINFFVEFGLNFDDVSKQDAPQTTNSGGTISDISDTNYNKPQPPNQNTKYADVNGKQIRRVEKAYGICADDGYGSLDTVYEYKYNRDDMTEIFNGNYGTSHLENPDAFLMSIRTFQYGWGSGGYVKSAYRWCGKELTNVEKMNLGTSRDYAPAVFVLGAEGTDFLDETPLEVPERPAATLPETTAPIFNAPETVAPETAVPESSAVVETKVPETVAPETKAPETVAPETNAPETTAPVVEEGGCGGSVSVIGVALVTALGTCVAFVSKKKED